MPGRALSGLDHSGENPLPHDQQETGNRLKQQMVDSETGEVVEKEQKGRGYELAKGDMSRSRRKN